MEKENTSFVQTTIPKFDGHEENWVMLMENLLGSKVFGGFADNGILTLPEAPAVATAEQIKNVEGKLKNLKAKNYLFQAIDRGLLETILKKNTSNEKCDSMKQKDQGSTKVRRTQLQALRRDFGNNE